MGRLTMNKIAYMGIGAIFTIILSFGWLGYANQISSSESTVHIGNLVSIDGEQQEIMVEQNGDNITFSLAESLWIHRNEEKSIIDDLISGDQVEMIFNSMNEVAFIKAHSVTWEEQKKSEEAPKYEKISEEPQVEEKTTKIESKEKVQATEKSQTQPTSLNQTAWKNFEIKIEAHHTEIKIKRENKNNKVKAEVKVETKNEEIKMKGQSAETFITQLLSNINVDAQTELNEVAYLIAKEFKLNPEEVKLEIKIKNEKKEYKFENDNVDNRDRDKDRGRDDDRDHEDDEEEDEEKEDDE